MEAAKPVKMRQALQDSVSRTFGRGVHARSQASGRTRVLRAGASRRRSLLAVGSTLFKLVALWAFGCSICWVGAGGASRFARFSYRGCGRHDTSRCGAVSETDVVESLDEAKAQWRSGLRPRPLFTGMYTGELSDDPAGSASDLRRLSVFDLEVGQTLNGTIHHTVRGKCAYVDVGVTALGILYAAEYRDGVPSANDLRTGDEVTVRVMAKEGQKLFLTRRSGSLERPILDTNWLRSPLACWTNVPSHITLTGKVVGMEFDTVLVRLRGPDVLKTLQTSCSEDAAFEEDDGWYKGRSFVGNVHRDDFPPGYEDTARLGDFVQVRLKYVDPLEKQLDLTMRNMGSREVADLELGETLQGVVITREKEGVFVDVGAQYDGLLPVSEFRDGFPFKKDKTLAKGSTVTVRVLSIGEDGRSFTLTRRTGHLKRPRHDSAAYTGDVNVFKTAHSWERVYDATVVGMTKSGVIARVKAVRGPGFVEAFVHSDDFEPEFFDVARPGCTVRLRLKYVDKQRGVLVMRMENAGSSDVDEDEDYESDLELEEEEDEVYIPPEYSELLPPGVGLDDKPALPEGEEEDEVYVHPEDSELLPLGVELDDEPALPEGEEEEQVYVPPEYSELLPPGVELDDVPALPEGEEEPALPEGEEEDQVDIPRDYSELLQPGVRLKDEPALPVGERPTV